MSLNQQTIAVFPLPVCLLVGGITELRIFEPRYIRLVKEAAAKQGFVMSLYDSSKPLETSEYGTLVDIIDFRTLDDGLLGIRVQAKKMVNLSEFSLESDGLHKAVMSPREHWSQYDVVDDSSYRLGLLLQQLIEQHEELNSYYPNGDYHNSAWVCARYIELLPLSFSKKQQLIFQQDLKHCLRFLNTLTNDDK